MSELKTELIKLAGDIQAKRILMAATYRKAEEMRTTIWQLEYEWRNLMRQWHEDENIVSPFDYGEKQDTVVREGYH